MTTNTATLTAGEKLAAKRLRDAANAKARRAAAKAAKTAAQVVEVDDLGIVAPDSTEDTTGFVGLDSDESSAVQDLIDKVELSTRAADAGETVEDFEASFEDSMNAGDAVEIDAADVKELIETLIEVNAALEAEHVLTDAECAALDNGVTETLPTEVSTVKVAREVRHCKCGCGTKVAPGCAYVGAHRPAKVVVEGAPKVRAAGKGRSLTACACGCGTMRPSDPRSLYVKGHRPKGAPGSAVAARTSQDGVSELAMAVIAAALARAPMAVLVAAAGIEVMPEAVVEAAA